jgi:hypothetical protein
VEGGSYLIESKTNLASSWNSKASNIVAQGITAQVTTNRNGGVEFFRASRTGLASFDPVK